MATVSTIRQILSDANSGLLPYLNNLLQTAEFTRFHAQFSFHAESAVSQVNVDNGDNSLQNALSIALKCAIVLEHQYHPDDAMQLALEFQEMLDTALVQWSKEAPLLSSPLKKITGTLGSLEETHYRGAYLPSFTVNRKFELTYSFAVASGEKANTLSSSEPTLYSPGERTPESGQYELTNLKGKGTGIEVTSTAGKPLPPTPEPNQLIQLVDPTKHKKAP